MVASLDSWRYTDSLLDESSRFEVRLSDRIKWQSSLFDLGLGDSFKCQVYFGQGWGGAEPIPGYATLTPEYTIDNFEMDFGQDLVIMTAKAIPNIPSLTTIRNATHYSPAEAVRDIASRNGLRLKGELPSYSEEVQQTRESDLEVLQRVAKEFDLALKIEGGIISLTPVSTLESYDSVFELTTDDIDPEGTFFSIVDYKFYQGVILSWESEITPSNWSVPVSSFGNASLNTNVSVNIPNISLGGSSSVPGGSASGTISGTTSDGKSVTGSCTVNFPSRSFNVNVSGGASGSGSGTASGGVSSSGTASVPREKKKQEIRLSVSDPRVPRNGRWMKYFLTEVPPDNASARTKGLLIIQRKNRERLTGTIRMPEGDPRCKAGMPIRLIGNGWGWPIDASGGTGNRYLISKAVHSFDGDSGWQTEIEVFKCYNQVSN